MLYPIFVVSSLLYIFIETAAAAVALRLGYCSAASAAVVSISMEKSGKQLDNVEKGHDGRLDTKESRPGSRTIDTLTNVPIAYAKRRIMKVVSNQPRGNFKIHFDASSEFLFRKDSGHNFCVDKYECDATILHCWNRYVCRGDSVRPTSQCVCV